jgi:hypothetical protein
VNVVLILVNWTWVVASAKNFVSYLFYNTW